MPSVSRRKVMEDVDPDAFYIEYASDATRKRYEAETNPVNKKAILENVVKKYKPAVDELASGGVFDLIDQLAECNIGPQTSSLMDTTQGGRRKKMRGGDLVAVKNALKKLWVEIVTATFTPENVMKGVPLAAIGIANPSAAGAAFSGVKSLLGFAGSVCLTSSGITALSIGALLLLYDVKFDLQNFKLPNPNQAQLDELKLLKEALQKNLKATAKFGSVAQPPVELLKKIEQLKAEQLKPTEIVTKLNEISTEASKLSDTTTAPPSTPTPAAPAADTTMKTGGRKTKKRGLKRKAKTRRSLFKY